MTIEDRLQALYDARYTAYWEEGETACQKIEREIERLERGA